MCFVNLGINGVLDAGGVSWTSWNSTVAGRKGSLVKLTSASCFMWSCAYCINFIL